MLKAGLKLLCLVGIGCVAGASICLIALYDRTGRETLNTVKRKMRLVPQGGYYVEQHYGSSEFNGVQSPHYPQWSVRRGFDVEQVATGFTYPVGIAFAHRGGSAPDEPWFYVTELHGGVRYVARDGSVQDFAPQLLNAEPTITYGTDETGVIGLCTIPDSDDLLVTTAYVNKEHGLYSNKILRLVSEAGGRRLKEIRELLDLKEFTAASHQIQQIAVGPDGKLYVSVGDGRNHPASLDLERFAGKILRMNLDGSPCEDNPFFKPGTPRSPSQYVYAYGLRNSHDFDFDPLSGRMYAMDNGIDLDRLVQITPGGVYGWNGSQDSTRVNALFTWGPLVTEGPAGFTFLRQATLGSDSRGRCYGAMAGKPDPNDASNGGKRIWEFLFDRRNGMLERMPEVVLEYNGRKKMGIVGLAEGPDGLYFTELFNESEGTGNEEGRGTIWRLVPSEETLGLPAAQDDVLAALPAAQRGHIWFTRNCTSCHRMDGVGGREGPDLTHAATNLEQRLLAPGYEAVLQDLLQSDAVYFQEQRPRLEEVAQAAGQERIRVWLRHHLEEPRFDNVHARMPGFQLALSREQRDDLIEYLLTRR